MSIKLDYDEGNVTLVEKNGVTWQTKQWIFKEQSIDFIYRWLSILEAMAVAIEEGQKLLESDKEEKDKNKVDFVEKVFRMKVPDPDFN